MTIPDKYEGLKFEVVKPITDKDRKYDPRRWRSRPGNTNAFPSTEELVQVIKKIFDENFEGNWVLEIRNTFSGEDLILKK